MKKSPISHKKTYKCASDYHATMSKETIEALIEGGKATAAPPLGPALGPLGVNISQIIDEINKKTGSFAGMQVPVKVIVDTETKDFTITIGTPPTASLLKKEAQVEKGSSNPKTEHVADMRIEQIIKVAKMKEDALLGRTLKEKVKEILGTANALGVRVEGVDAVETSKLVDEGKFDKEIKEEKTEVSEAELEKMKQEREELLKEIEERREEFEKTTKSIISQMEGKPRSEIKGKLLEEGIPAVIIEELLPREEVPAEGEAAAPAAEGEKETEKEKEKEKEKE